MPLAFFPSLMEGRHYHAITTFDLIPYVVGGWNNGSLNTMEYLDPCGEEMEWKKGKGKLMLKRERFAFTRVPKGFITVDDCVEEEQMP